MNLHDLRQAQANFDIAEITEKRKPLHKLRQAFVKDFSPQQIAQMHIDDFVAGKGGATFCNRLERELDGLGRLLGSTAIKFGVYYSKKQEDYLFSKKWGADYKSAFKNIRQAILDLLQAGKNRDMEAIVASRISPMFKGKILSVYYPELYLNVFSPEHLNHFLAFFDKDSEQNIHADAVYKREALVAFKNQDEVMNTWSIDHFSHFLYDRYPCKPVKDVDSNQILSDYQNHTFPLNPTPMEVSLNIVPAQASTNKTPSTVKDKKPDYEKEQRLLKQLGDRGEEIVKRFEINRLESLGLTKQAGKVDRVSLISDAYGYDVLSYNDDNSERYIEVKATKAKVGDANFYLTQNEYNTALEKKENYYIYMVYDILSKEPKIWIISNPFYPVNKDVIIQPVNYRVSIKTGKE